jgi:hypothetical protein
MAIDHEAKIEVFDIEITRADFRQFRELQRRRRWDWPALFRLNRHGEIWPFTTNGYTPHGLRENLLRVSAVLDRIAVKYRLTCCEAGRFFIDGDGAYYKDHELVQRRFVRFVC